MLHESAILTATRTNSPHGHGNDKAQGHCYHWTASFDGQSVMLPAACVQLLWMRGTGLTAPMTTTPSTPNKVTATTTATATNPLASTMDHYLETLHQAMIATAFVTESPYQHGRHISDTPASVKHKHKYNHKDEGNGEEEEEYSYNAAVSCTAPIAHDTGTQLSSRIHWRNQVPSGSIFDTRQQGEP
jgi:hypothetical protein